MRTDRHSTPTAGSEATAVKAPRARAKRTEGAVRKSRARVAPAKATTDARATLEATLAEVRRLQSAVARQQLVADRLLGMLERAADPTPDEAPSVACAEPVVATSPAAVSIAPRASLVAPLSSMRPAGETLFPVALTEPTPASTSAFAIDAPPGFHTPSEPPADVATPRARGARRWLPSVFIAATAAVAGAYAGSWHARHDGRTHAPPAVASTHASHEPAAAPSAPPEPPAATSPEPAAESTPPPPTVRVAHTRVVRTARRGL